MYKRQTRTRPPGVEEIETTPGQTAINLTNFPLGGLFRVDSQGSFLSRTFQIVGVENSTTPGNLLIRFRPKVVIPGPYPLIPTTTITAIPTSIPAIRDTEWMEAVTIPWVEGIGK